MKKEIYNVHLERTDLVPLICVIEHLENIEKNNKEFNPFKVLLSMFMSDLNKKIENSSVEISDED